MHILRTVRTLHQTTKKEVPKFADICIDNPYQLAYELLSFQPIQSSILYPKRMRLSQIANACSRACVLGFRHSISIDSKLYLPQQTTFDIGNAFHEWLQNSPLYFGDRRMGWWECTACGYCYFGKPRKTRCNKCGARAAAFRYKEHAMALDNPLVSGHPDMFYVVSPADIRILELKTVNGEEFEKLTQPLIEHVFQVNGYMYYLPKDKTLPIRINQNEAFIVYASKRHTTSCIPYKAFIIKRDDSIIEQISEKLTLFTQGIQNPTYLPPPLPACEQTEWKSSTAKACPVLDFCQESINKQTKT